MWKTSNQFGDDRGRERRVEGLGGGVLGWRQLKDISSRAFSVAALRVRNSLHGHSSFRRPHPCLHYCTWRYSDSLSSGFLRSGKVRENREGQGKVGNFKILLTRPIIYALYSQFLSASGGSALVNTAGYFILQYFTMEQSLVLHLCT